MSIERLPDESWEQFKARQKVETQAAKYARQHGRLLVDSSKALGITQKGIDAARKRKMLYEMKSIQNKKVKA